MQQTIFQPGEILLPAGVDMTKWSVVACDQYTSQPEYWKSVEELVGDAPSTLKITLPELYLEQENIAERIRVIHQEMERLLKENILACAGAQYLYLERTQRNGAVRRGLMGLVDLEAYDYSVGSQSPIRATEGTVLSRIPPRLRVREGAAMESPHVMLLVDDRKKTVIEPLSLKKEKFEPCYDVPLMMDSGWAKGWIVDDASAENIDGALAALLDQAAFEKKYNVCGKGVLLFAVGDGNHSLATAKALFEGLKKELPEEVWRSHPARYALVELVNLHEEALQFEPIHRVLFGVEPEKVIEELKAFYRTASGMVPGQQGITYLYGGKREALSIENPSANLAVGTLQNFIDSYLSKHGGSVDYIHGEDVVETLSRKADAIGFLLPDMAKDDLFQTVIVDGALPRKTFSMGHAEDKRFYLECRKIK